MRQIIFVNRFYAPDHSATAQILTDLCAYLAAEGAPVRVVASRLAYDGGRGSLKAEETLGGVEVRRVWTFGFGRGSLAGRLIDYLSFYIGAFIRLWLLVRAGDVVVAKTDPPLILIVADLVCRAKRARLVGWHQDLYPEVAVAAGMWMFAGGLREGLTRLRNVSLRHAALNVAVSESMAANLAKVTGKVAVVHNWTDDEAITPAVDHAESLREEWGFNPSDVIVAYSGNLGRLHEAETLYQAALILRNHPSIKFLFVGGGLHTEALMARARGEGLSNLRFKPYQPRDRLNQSLSLADLHWLSLRPEFEGLAFPSKFYGVAAAGRPIIAVTDRNGDVARLVDRYGIGVVTPPGDGQALATVISTLAADPRRRKDMGASARLMLEAHFTRRQSLARWASLLGEVSAA